MFPPPSGARLFAYKTHIMHNGINVRLSRCPFVIGVTVRWAKNPKTKHERQINKPYCGKLRTRPDHYGRRRIKIKFCIGDSPLGDSFKCQVVLKIQMEIMGSNFAVFHCFGHWLVQKLVLLNKP